MTRRILLAPPGDALVHPNHNNNKNEGVLEGAEPFGETVDLNQFTVEERRMGLDWKEYLPPVKQRRRQGDIKKGQGEEQGPSFLTSVSSVESETEYHTETDASDTGGEASPTHHSQRTARTHGNSNHHQHHQPSSRAMKLDRRSVSRMEAFLASCSMALPNDPLHHHHSYPSKSSSTTTNGSTNTKQNNAFSLQSLKNVVQEVKSSNSKVSSVVQVFSNLTKPPSSKEESSSSSSTNPANSTTKPRSRSMSEHAMYPQIHVEDLTHRLTLYLKSIRRVHLHSSPSASTTTTTTTEEDTAPPNHDHLCLLSHEPPRALQARIQLLLTSFASTTNTISSIRPILTKLLSFLTLELLSVEVLSEDLTSTIRNIVLEYEHLTSFASLAFLSSPQESTEEYLLPLLTKYVEYLVQDWRFCIERCQLESQLNRCLDPAIRSMFKTMEFRSIGHLLEVCHEHRSDLENIVIKNSRITPSRDVLDDPKALKQSMRDLRREIIVVNGHVLPPIHSLKELVALLKETLNSRPLKLKEKRIGQLSKRSLKECHIQGSISESCSSESDIVTSSSETDFVSSGNEGDTDGSMSDAVIRSRALRSNSTSSSENANNCKVSASKPSRRKTNNFSAIDIMTRRLLMAASRTGVGGDAFFIVRDLFGGEGVEVVHNQNDHNLGTHKKHGTIELIVRLASITIKCHSKFDVYPQSQMGECEPLIQLHTTTTERIDLQEVRADDESTTAGPCPDDKNKATVLLLREKKGDSTGLRHLFIRPAKYEKIEEWHTPS